MIYVGKPEKTSNGFDFPTTYFDLVVWKCVGTFFIGPDNQFDFSKTNYGGGKQQARKERQLHRAYLLDPSSLDRRCVWR